MRCDVPAMALLAALAGGCGDFRAAEDLRHARILAVRAERPHLGAGEETRVDVLATRDDGVPFETAPDVLSVAPDPRGAPVPPAIAALVSQGAAGWMVRAPGEDELALAREVLGLPAGAPIVLPLQATLALDGDIKVAQKAVLLGSTGANPTLGEVAVDGTPLAPGADVVLPVGGRHVLGATAGPAGAALSFAWYSAVGELDHYRTPEATLTAAQPATGALVVVVRDERGGVAWRVVSARIE